MAELEMNRESSDNFRQERTIGDVERQVYQRKSLGEIEHETIHLDQDPTVRQDI